MGAIEILTYISVKYVKENIQKFQEKPTWTEWVVLAPSGIGNPKAGKAMASSSSSLLSVGPNGLKREWKRRKISEKDRKNKGK